jgi:hypothetical protein
MKTNKVGILFNAFDTATGLISHNSQRKAENFYTSANVKNKSRSKAALMKSLPVGKKGGSKSRKG